MKGVVIYTRLNTSSVSNHVMYMHTYEHKALKNFYNGKMWHDREEILMDQGSSQMRRKVEDSDLSISFVSDL